MAHTPLLSFQIFKWDFWIEKLYEKIDNKPLHIEGDRFDRELWLFGRIHIVISDCNVARPVIRDNEEPTS